jgi:hypothetical protein
MALEDEAQVILCLPTENEARRTRDKIRFDRRRPAYIKTTASYPRDTESDFDADPRVVVGEAQHRKGPSRMVYPGSTRKTLNNVNETSKKSAEFRRGVSLGGGGDDEEGSDDERKGGKKSESGTSIKAASLPTSNDKGGTTANHDTSVALEDEFLVLKVSTNLRRTSFPENLITCLA